MLNFRQATSTITLIQYKFTLNFFLVTPSLPEKVNLTKKLNYLKPPKLLPYFASTLH